MLCDTMSQNNKRCPTGETKKAKKTIFLSEIVDDLWDCNFVEIIEEPSATQNNILFEQIIFEEECQEEIQDIFSALELAKKDSGEIEENLHSSKEADTSEQKVIMETDISCSYKLKPKHIINDQSSSNIKIIKHDKINHKKKNKITSKETPPYIVYNNNQNDPVIRNCQVFDQNQFEEIHNVEKNEKKVVIKVLRKPKSSVFYDISKKNTTFDDNDFDEFINTCNSIDIIKQESDTSSEKDSFKGSVDSLKDLSDTNDILNDTITALNPVRFTCKQCNFETGYRSSLFRHVKGVHKNPNKPSKIHKCDECDFETYNQTNLNRHINIAHRSESDKLVPKRKRIIKCSKCNFQTGYKSNLNRHIKKIHKVKRTPKSYKKLLCDQCNFQTYQMSNLNRHIKEGLHEPIKLDINDVVSDDQRSKLIILTSDIRKIFKCDQCDLRTAYPKNLKRHVKRVHDPAKAVQKPVSESEAENDEIQESEEVVVKAKKVYKCNECDFKSDYGRSLSRHRKLMHVEEMLKCSLCSYETKHWYRFKTHIRHHSQNQNRPSKLYKCGKCNFQAIVQKSFVDHQSRVHGDKQKLTCQYCEFNTVYSTSFGRHLKRKHNVTRIVV